MGEPWITMFATLLGIIGVLAELNLLRIFLRDWREGRREERRRLRSDAPARRRARVWQQPSGFGSPALAACVTAGLLPAAVHSQDSSSTTPPERASNMTSTDLLSP